MTDTAQSNRDYSAEHHIQCAECGHIYPGGLGYCKCCDAVTTIFTLNERLLALEELVGINEYVSYFAMTGRGRRSLVSSVNDISDTNHDD